MNYRTYNVIVANPLYCIFLLVTFLQNTDNIYKCGHMLYFRLIKSSHNEKQLWL